VRRRIKASTAFIAANITDVNHVILDAGTVAEQPGVFEDRPAVILHDPARQPYSGLVGLGVVSISAYCFCFYLIYRMLLQATRTNWVQPKNCHAIDASFIVCNFRSGLNHYIC
jgi:hypothetical protein